MYINRYAGDDYYFIINRAKLEDRGEYIIRAENHYGFREEVVFLNVQRELPTILHYFTPASFPPDVPWCHSMLVYSLCNSNIH